MSFLFCFWPLSSSAINRTCKLKMVSVTVVCGLYLLSAITYSLRVRSLNSLVPLLWLVFVVLVLAPFQFSFAIRILFLLYRSRYSCTISVMSIIVLLLWCISSIILRVILVMKSLSYFDFCL